jgi:hypothetical protein
MKHAALLLLLAAPVAAQADAILPAFDAAAFDPAATVTHPYLALAPGYYHEFTGIGVDDAGKPTEERDLQTLIGPGPVILGVQTTVVQDQAWVNGQMIENTLDFYAQDRDGNVWYMGEDATSILYDAAGKVSGTNTHSSWRAGIKGAQPGYAMPANPAAGFAYEQEHSPADEAMDLGLILANARPAPTPVSCRSLKARPSKLTCARSSITRPVSAWSAKMKASTTPMATPRGCFR